MARSRELRALHAELVQPKRAEAGGRPAQRAARRAASWTTRSSSTSACCCWSPGTRRPRTCSRLGTFALLQPTPRSWARCATTRGLAESAVEELLRYLTIVHFGPVRSALEDVELDGQLIRAGESVAISPAGGQPRPGRFAGPRHASTSPGQAAGHLSFGHGVHQCLGQQLARVEMRIAYPALLTALPGLRLAVPPEEVPMRSNMAIYGVHRLPVTW